MNNNSKILIFQPAYFISVLRVTKADPDSSGCQVGPNPGQDNLYLRAHSHIPTLTQTGTVTCAFASHVRTFQG